MAFLLSFGINFFKQPTARKLYSTGTGLFIGFYYHGISNFFYIFYISILYAVMKLLPKEKVFYPVLVLTTLLFSLRSFYQAWDGNLDAGPRCQAQIIWVRSIMWAYHLHDSLVLDDSEKSKQLGDYERREA